MWGPSAASSDVSVCEERGGRRGAGARQRSYCGGPQDSRKKGGAARLRRGRLALARVGGAPPEESGEHLCARPRGRYAVEERLVGVPLEKVAEDDEDEEVVAEDPGEVKVPRPVSQQQERVPAALGIAHLRRRAGWHQAGRGAGTRGLGVSRRRLGGVLEVPRKSVAGGVP